MKVFGLAFALMGGRMLFFWFLPTLTKAIGSMRWTETPCTVISSRVESHSDSDGTTYRVDIFYRYTVDGREFRSNRFDLFEVSSSGYRGKAEVVTRYPAGSSAVCYVNPGNPNEAVLEPGLGWSALFGLLPTAFFLVGMGILFSGGQRASAAAPPASEGVTPRAPKLKASPIMSVVVTTIIALFWNGLVWTVLWHVIDGFQHGSPDWFAAVFLTPFVLVGLGTIGAVGYFLMALTNPRCRVQLSPGVLEPGQPFEVSWTFQGSLQRIRRLRIFLEGREEATYRRGTSNCTDRHAFARLGVAEVTSSMEIGQGEARCQLPEGVVASFEAPNNKIVWSLKVHGEISCWPDVFDEYEVVVSPGNA